METFSNWLRKECQGGESIDEQLYLLARQPSWHILKYQGYEINENTFYTVAQDKRSTNQNSGVRIDDTDPKSFEYQVCSAHQYLQSLYRPFFHLRKLEQNVVQISQMCDSFRKSEIQEVVTSV